MPLEVVQSVTALIDLCAKPGAQPKTEDLRAVLKYVAGVADAQVLDLPKKYGAAGAAVSASINTSLQRILEYGYHPGIPANVVYPAMIRESGWLADSDFAQEKPQLWDKSGTLEAPFIIRGREFEEITPDTFSGAFYRYTMDRVLLRTSYEGRDVFVSITQQDGPSSVGKKGLVLDDATWNYLYSEEEGLTKGGMTWMDTYMYGSASVSVYIQDAANPQHTTCMMFKWLRAGWAKLNVVRSKHIAAGCERSVRSFRQVIESPKLPSSNELAAQYASLTKLSDEELDAMMRTYVDGLQRFRSENELLEDGLFASLLDDYTYVKQLNRAQKVNLMMKSYLRTQLGIK
ncbi:hypothetical protein [Desulfobaculum bizertense]|uniref:hypothetical protein n=1 Tax=Desulfobaculum bizertense TaxID=376490 RepID=UPI00117F981E|nr:hypothetical protein [Desulfobaculum bizertense]